MVNRRLRRYDPAGLTRGTSADMASTPKKPAPKPAAEPTAKPVFASANAAAIPAPRASMAPPPRAAGGAEDTVPTLRKKELIERVVKASGIKKKDAKPVIEAMLQVLGDALTAGEELVLPPFGKAKVNRQKDLAQGEMMIVKLRRRGDTADAVPAGDDDSDDTLADAGEGR